MRVTYLVPFRVPFSMDKEALLDRRDDWLRLMQAGPLPGVPNAEFGNYGWAQESDRALHGSADTDGSPLFTWHYFTLRFGRMLDPHALPEAGDDEEPGDLLRGGSDARWEVRFVSNTVAILILAVEVPLDAFCRYLEQRRGEMKFFQYGARWARRVLEDPLIDVARSAVCAHLKGFVREEQALLADPNSNMYAQDGKRPLWAHTCYVFSEEERSQLRAGRESFLRLFSDSALSATWLDGGENAYGWGSSAIMEGTENADQWLNGASTSQYYYACLDIADFELSVNISKQFNAAKQGELHGVTSAIRDLVHKVRRIQSDYEYARIRANAEGARALAGYHEHWLFKDLLDSVASKVEWLSDLRGRVAEDINEANQRQLSKVLGFISAFSLIFLIINIHGYITDNYDPRDPRGPAGWLFDASYLAVLAVGVALCFVLWRYTVIKSRTER